MKKYLFLLLLLAPQITNAQFVRNWNGTSTTQGDIYPNAVNGVNQRVGSWTSMFAPFFTATSTTATSTFAGGVFVGTTTPYDVGTNTFYSQGDFAVKGSVLLGNGNGNVEAISKDGYGNWSFSALVNTGGGNSGGLNLFNINSGKTPFRIASSTDFITLGGYGDALFIYTPTAMGTNASIMPFSEGPTLIYSSLTPNFRSLFMGVINDSTYETGIIATSSNSVSTDRWLSFRTNNGERMRIDSAGSVGIGTTTPNAKLNIFSSGTDGLTIDNTSNSNFLRLATAGSVKWTQYLNGNDMRFYDELGGGSDTLILKSGGNVGVGTTSPFGKFSINELSGTKNALLVTGSSNTNYAAIVENNGSTALGLKIRVGSAAGAIPFIINNYADTSTFFTVLGSGNVGIGITAPTAKLSIGTHTEPAGGIASSTVAYFSNDNVVSGTSTISILSRSSAPASINFGSQLGERSGYIDYQIGAIANQFIAGTMRFGTLGNDRMFLDGNGNLGVGTTSPFQKLTVIGTGTFGAITSGQTSFLESQGTPDFGSALYLTSDRGTTQGAVRLLSTENLSSGNGLGTVQKSNLAFQYSTNAKSYGSDPKDLTWATGLLMDGNSGNIGIGSTTPFAKLSIVGSSGTIFAVATSTTAGSTNPVFSIDANGHPFYSGPKPSCDANCTLVAGNDARFRVKTGSSITSTVVTFANTWGSLAPICLAEEGDAGIVGATASSTPTNVTITLASALTSKDIEVLCDGIK